MRKIMLALAMAGGHWLAAQTPKEALTQKLNTVFQHIDPALSPTGRFYDKGMTLINPLSFHHPDPDSVNAGLDRFGMLYSTLKTAELPRAIPLPEFNSLIQQSESYPRNQVPMAYLDLDYHFLKGDALTEGKVRVENEEIFPTAPYAEFLQEETAIALSSTRLTAEGPDVTFIFPSFLWKAEEGRAAPVIKLDFDDGSGWNTVNTATGILHHFTGQAGPRTIKYRIESGGGNIRQGNFSIHIIMATTATADAEWQILPVAGQHSGGSVYIEYAWNNNSGHVKKPLIILEGVDYYQVAPDLITQGNWNWVKSSSLFDKLKSSYNLDQDYDFIYLDYAQGADAIERNAALLRDVLALVNADKVLGGSTEQNVVIGYSMGGLVARYCLSKMAKEGVNSQTRLLITHDSPHQGANMPLGLQYLFQEIKEDLAWTGLFPMINQANAIFTAPASAQMLTYRATSSTGFAVNSWIDQIYTPMITFSAGSQPFEVVATSLGSECGVKSFSSYQKLFEVNINLKYYNIFNPVMLAIAGPTDWELGLAAYGMPESGTATIAKLRLDYTRYILWVIPVSVNIYNFSKSNPPGKTAIDGVPGGYYPLSTFMKIPLAGFDIGIVQFRPNVFIAKGFTFIPTKSALDVDGNSTTAYTQAYNAWTVLSANSRINTFRSAEAVNNEKNMAHLNLTPLQANFMAKKIKNQPLTQLCPAECSMVADFFGQEAICPGTSGAFGINPSGGGAGHTYAWSVSAGASIENANANPVNVTVDPNNTIETLTLTGTVTRNGCPFTKAFQIHAVSNISEITIKCGSQQNVTLPGDYICKSMNQSNPSMVRYVYINSIPVGGEFHPT